MNEAVVEKPKTKKEDIKDALEESKDMVGEKHQAEGIFHKIFRGYVPLNFLSDLSLELEGEQKERIDAYCEIIKLALRRSESSLDYLLKGYGAEESDLKDKQALIEDYNKEKERQNKEENRTKELFKNPSSAQKDWINELNLNEDNFSKAVLNPFQIDQDGYVPPDVLARMSSIGLLRLKVPKANGGLGFTQKEYDMVLQSLAHVSGTILALVSAHSTIGSAPLLMYGSEEQKSKYLGEVSKGEYLVAFGLTEPTSGTDAVGKMKSIAKLSEDGKNWIINGEKIYITNIHRSGVVYLMAKTDTGKDLPVERMKPTVFIVELPFRITDSMEDINNKRAELHKLGMKMSKPLDLMMIRGSNQAHITFDNFKVPVDNVLGGVEGGNKVIFNGLNKGRAGFGASSAEAARHIFYSSLKHASTREMFKVFGGKQSDLPQVKKYISEMATRVCALRTVSDLTTAIIQEHGDEVNIIAECAAIKILATEGNWSVSNYALRLWGGTGTMKGHPGGMEVNLRDAWIGIVVEGVNEAMKQLVAGVGVQAVKGDADTIGRHLMWFVKPFMGSKKSDSSKSKKRKPFKPDFFGGFIKSHFNLAAGMLHFETGDLDFGDALWIQLHAKVLSMKTAVLGLKYGNKMVVQQMELIRMSEVAMDLFSIAAVQIKLKKHGHEIIAAEKLALKRFVDVTKSRVNATLGELYIGNKHDKADTKVADLWVKEAPEL